MMVSSAEFKSVGDYGAAARIAVLILFVRLTCVAHQAK